MEKLVIALSGTPGTGKSVVGEHLARLLGMEPVELNTIAIRERLFTQYDNDRLSYVVDEVGLRSYIRSLVLEKRRVLIIGHYSEIVDDDVLDKIVVLRLNPIELAQRLLNRGWPIKKVIENVEAELLGVCTNNALSEHPPEKVCEVDVSGKKVDEIVKEIVDVVTGLRSCKVYVDWLSNEEAVSYVLSLESNLAQDLESDG